MLRRLLELQEHDRAIRLLDHRKQTLPEAQRLAEVVETLRELDSDVDIARKQQEEIEREQRRVEGEAGLLDGKIAGEEKRLFSGAVSNPRELSSLQAEVEMLKKKKSRLEDSLLEVMVHSDQAAETLRRLESELQQASEEHDSLSRVVSKITREIDVELDEHTRARAEIVPEVPDALLTLYEQLRDQKSGVGAAALEGDTCQGCHTKLPAVEVERVRREGGLQRCDNCRRILVVA